MNESDCEVIDWSTARASALSVGKGVPARLRKSYFRRLNK